MPRLPTPISKQLRALLEHFATQAGHELPLTIARQNLDGSELEFANLLVEDKNNGEMAYGDCAYIELLLYTFLLRDLTFQSDVRPATPPPGSQEGARGRPGCGREGRLYVVVFELRQLDMHDPKRNSIFVNICVYLTMCCELCEHLKVAIVRTLPCRSGARPCGTHA